jgi:hypothetical protein
VFESRVLRKICGTLTDDIAGERKLHNEELCNFHLSLNISRMIKLRRMRWVCHAARMVEINDADNIMFYKHREKSEAYMGG